MPLTTCSVTGTVYLGDASPATGATLIIRKVLLNGSLISLVPVEVHANTVGFVTFNLPQGSVAYIEGKVVGFDVAGGVALTIPNSSTATLESLLAAISYPLPPAGMTVLDEGTNVGSLIQTMDFVGTQVQATQTAPGAVRITMTGGLAGGISGAIAQWTSSTVLGNLANGPSNSVLGGGGTPAFTTDPVVASIDAGTYRVSGSSLNFSHLAGAIAIGQVPNDLLTYQKIQNVSASPRFLGRITAGAGDIEELTGTQAATLIDLFTTSTQGVVPGSGGGTANFLRADGTWAAPPGSLGTGDVTSNTTVSVDSELALFNGTTGKSIKRATGSGLAALSAGVLSTVNTSAGLRAQISDVTGTGVLVFGTGPTISAGIFNATATLGLRSTGAAFDLQLGTSEVLTANRNLNIVVNDGNRTLTVAANATISGTNTGDQTISLTGDVNGSGTGSFAATIVAQAVTFSKIQNVVTGILIGRSTAGTGSVETINIGSGLSLSGGTLSATGTGTGDVSSNTSVSVDSEVAIFNGTTGKSIKRATGSGLAVLTSGVLSTITTSAALAAQLSDETGIGNLVFAINSAMVGGTHSAITSFGLRSTGAAFDLQLASNEALTASRTLTILLNDAARTLTVAGNATISGTSSGTNTGDQTITLTGDVTGSGTGSFAATIANQAVSFSKIQNVATGILIGRSTAGTGSVETITVGAGLTLSGGVLSAGSGVPGGSNGQVQFNNSGAFGGAAALIYATSGTLLTVVAQISTDKPLVVKGAVSQSSNLQEWQNNSGSPLAFVDSSGNITANSFITTGTGAGYVELMQGTAPGLGTTSVRIYADTAVTSYKIRVPATSATGFLLGTDTSNDNVLSFVGFTGSGNVVRSAGPSFTADITVGSSVAISGTNSMNVFVSSAGTKPAVRYLSTGTGTGKWQFSNDGSTFTDLGTSTGVTSVAMTVPSWLTVTGSPITTSGTLAVTGTTGQTANQVLATPDGATGAVGLRALVGADVPVFTSTLRGAVPGSGGGTTNFLRADGTWVAPSGGGTVTNVTGTSPISVATGTTTPVVSLLVNVDHAFTVGQSVASGSIAANAPLLNLSQTWNNAGVTFTGVLINITQTAGGGSSKAFDYQKAGVSKVNWDVDGNMTIAGGVTGQGLIRGGSASLLGWQTRSSMLSSADGKITLLNNAQTGFTALLFGGTTTSFPALFVNATALDLKLADASAFTGLNTGDHTIGAGTAISGTNAMNLFASSAGTKPALRYLSTGTGTGKWQFSNDGSVFSDMLSGTSPSLTTPTITGGTHTGLTSLGIRSTGTGAFDLTLANSENLTAGRTLTIALNDAARTLTISANATVSGTNTGDQTITLTGDVTGSGIGSFAATIANSAVTLAKMANVATQTLLGRSTAGSGAPESLTLGNGLSISGGVVTANGQAGVNSQSAAYTLVAADSGQVIYHPSSDNNARTFTIPSNASVGYAVGTMITFYNEVNTVTIAITSDTLTLAGAGTTGSRTLAANGIATAVKVASTKWVISGNGLT